MSKKRAVILLLTLFVVVALSFAIHAAMQLLPGQQYSIRRQLVGYQGSLAADAGVHAAMERIEFNLDRGRPQPATESLGPGRPDLLGAFSYNVTIVPDARTLAGDTSRVYAVTSVGYFRNQAVRRVEAVLTTQSFAKWVWFHDTRPTDLYLPLSSWTFDGPLHFNSPIRAQDLGSSFYAGNHVPFLANTTSSTRIDNVAGEPGVPSWASRGDGVKYTESGGSMTAAAAPYDTQTGAALGNRYRRLFQGGRDALRTGVATVQMPLGFDALRDAAWASAAPLPSPGVYVTTQGASTVPAGGVLISGSASEVEMHTNNTNSGLRIRQGNYDYDWVQVTDQAETVTSTNSTGGVVQSHLVSPGQSYLRRRRVGSAANVTVSVFTGQSNGVVFCTGNIASLYGVNKLARTIAVDLENRREMTITDDVTRADTPVNAEQSAPSPLTPIRPRGTRDVLGLVGWKVHVSSQREGRSDYNPLYVYASLYAGHQKDANDSRWNADDELGGFFDDYTSGGSGVLQLFGGIQMAYKNATTYSLQLHYDPLLAAAPPPFYPSFNRCKIISWREYPVAR